MNKQRQKLISSAKVALEKMQPRTFKDTDIARLADLIDLALQPPYAFSGDQNTMREFGVTDKAAFWRLSEDICAKVKKLLQAARDVAALMPDDVNEAGFDRLAADYPWLANINQFNGTVADILSSENAADLSPVLTLRRAVTLLTPLKAVAGTAGGRRGRPPFEGSMRQVVRAACVFCHENPHLKFQRTWLTVAKKTLNSGRRGGKPVELTNDQIGLPTQTAEIIDLAVCALWPEAKRATMRTHFRNYVRELRGRPPREADLIQWNLELQEEE